MKQLFYITFTVIILAVFVVFGLTFWQVQQQQKTLTEDFQKSTALLADSFKESIRSSYLNNATTSIQTILNKFADKGGLLGLAVYNSNGDVFSSSEKLSADLVNQKDISAQAIEEDGPVSKIVKVDKNNIFIYSTPLHEDERVVGALTIFQKADYINTVLNNVWKNNILRLFILILLFSVSVFFIFNFIVNKPIGHLVETIRQARSGKLNSDFEIEKKSVFFKPVASEITKMARSLILARTSASEEAKMRLAKIDSPWTAERLKEFFKVHLKDRTIFVVSNREPYIHKKVKDKIIWEMPASGMVTALEPVLEACGGMWIAHGSGDADKATVDDQDKIAVPPDEPKYTLKRVWLSEKEKKEYYNGFANEALYPLCLLAHTRPLFRKQDWITYRKVNGKFAQVLLEEIKNVPRPIVLIQDYHFALLSEMVKKSRPDASVGLFWHIPWPSAEVFSICPWRKEILRGMLGADVLGFNTQQHCNNFLETASKEIESITDLENFAVTHKNHTTYIKPFPISVAFTNGDKTQSFATKSSILEESGIKTKFLGVGVDRLDYTKGILERFKGLEFFFDLYPQFKGQFTFLQIASPSRQEVPRYNKFSEEVTREAQRINQRFESDGWKPIVLLKEYHTHEEIYPLYKAAQVCLVTSLSDGMNLVAKEYIASKNDELGVLILSQFAGAAKELKEALIINPYSAEETAEAIYKALTMSVMEQKRRMKKMRDAIKDYNVYRWAAEFLKSIISLS